MRALLTGERHATFGVILGLVAVMCLLAGSLGLTLSYRHELQRTRATLIERCGQTQGFRTEVQRWATATVAAEQRNHVADPRVRAQRIAAAQAVVDYVEQVNRADCTKLYASVIR